MVKATGIVRRIDDLGRVVIPKEIRRTLRIREGDPLEIYVDREGEVILKKYSPVGELSDFAKEYADSLHEAIEHVILVADRDNIVAVAGAPKKEYLNKAIGPVLEKAIEERKVTVIHDIAEYCSAHGIELDEDDDFTRSFTSQVIAPIIVEGDTIGAVLISTKQPNLELGNMELKLAETAAAFLSKQMAP